MGFREEINKRKSLAVAGTIILLVIVGVVLYTTNSGKVPTLLSTGYYSDDDGKTWFKDDAGKLCPFDHNGRQAVRAYVFRYGGGDAFVGYLGKLTDAGIKQAEELKRQPLTPESGQALGGVLNSALMLKRPGDSKWQPAVSPGASAILNLVPPAGTTGELSSVDP
jgi:hypothetical protein